MGGMECRWAAVGGAVLPCRLGSPGDFSVCGDILRAVSMLPHLCRTGRGGVAFAGMLVPILSVVYTYIMVDSRLAGMLRLSGIYVRELKGCQSVPGV